MGIETNQHEQWMQAALAQARLAESIEEVPVGAVVVADGQIIGQGYNQVIRLHDPTAHAEIMALRDAAQQLGNYRLPQTTLYVTLEPCMMCAGSMVHARIGTVIYGAADPKTGIINSRDTLLHKPYHFHQIEAVGGVLEQQCSALLTAFFKRRRAEKKSAKDSASD
ncbi:tRNA adenosine(34) deaminase TadA [Marinicella sp. W31]|uniref:tRNA adenosine(34) deaminase TadA n=1 Tax=Marinicella sp. W31 TaxID=3023713 RepID=UPI0037584ADC